MDKDITIVVASSTDVKTKMEHIQQTANKICPLIHVTIDYYPSKHADGKFPVLDSKQWIEDDKIIHT